MKNITENPFEELFMDDELPIQYIEAVETRLSVSRFIWEFIALFTVSFIATFTEFCTNSTSNTTPFNGN